MRQEEARLAEVLELRGQENDSRGFPGGPVAKTPHFQYRGPGFYPDQGSRSCMLQLRVRVPQARPSAAKQINTLKFKKIRERERTTPVAGCRNGSSLQAGNTCSRDFFSCWQQTLLLGASVSYAHTVVV